MPPHEKSSKAARDLITGLPPLSAQEPEKTRARYMAQTPPPSITCIASAPQMQRSAPKRRTFRRRISQVRRARFLGPKIKYGEFWLKRAFWQPEINAGRCEEQILARHSRVFGAGELTLARENFQRLAGNGGSDWLALNNLSRLDGPTIRSMADRQLNRAGFRLVLPAGMASPKLATMPRFAIRSCLVSFLAAH